MEDQKYTNQKELVCIRCPVGCLMSVTYNPDGSLHVTGNSCKRGEEYARKELTNPTRLVTSTVRIKGRNHQVLPVKTKEDIPKGKIWACMEALKQIEAEAPISIGDVILADVAGTGVDIVATKHIK